MSIPASSSSHKFQFSSLWEPAKIDSQTGKSLTIPLFNLKSPYGRNFHLSWIAFFVAFLSWFAFPPLLTLSIKSDLRLTAEQVANSNIIGLLGTFVVRLVAGPMVDKFGPRLVMAGILIAGTIPTGLAAIVNNVAGFYGGSFVPCEAWTSLFFHSSIVGMANAIVAGLGNSGGGATYAVMVALYHQLHRNLSQHLAWRVAFLVVPVPALLLVALMVVIFGTDHPSGKWSTTSQSSAHLLRSALLLQPVTYIPCIAYLTTFGFELAVDSTLATTLITPHPELGQLNAGYLASVYGLMNIFTRPLGGAAADWLYRRHGTIQGLFSVALGRYLQINRAPRLNIMMGLVVLTSLFNGMANGANFAYVPNVNPDRTGAMNGLVGAFGNLGGVVYTLIFRCACFLGRISTEKWNSLDYFGDFGGSGERCYGYRCH
ncbi:MFS general substrate transporter [Gymnopus androsaceus JB14]|uniref:MFS general substrate transporter n=1 Tax=Gymnopus androsaceus JB14 TaxID=1447944 RepID=A0A6A4I177_9AGAR|nr:MFS general substrate transporter [Gymnopus androsaceus JB14]